MLRLATSFALITLVPNVLMPKIKECTGAYRQRARYSLFVLTVRRSCIRTFGAVHVGHLAQQLNVFAAQREALLGSLHVMLGLEGAQAALQRAAALEVLLVVVQLRLQFADAHQERAPVQHQRVDVALQHARFEQNRQRMSVALFATEDKIHVAGLHHHHLALLADKVVHLEHIGLLHAKVHQVGKILAVIGPREDNDESVA